LGELGAESEVQLCKIQLAQLLYESAPDSKKVEFLTNGFKQAVNFQVMPIEKKKEDKVNIK
jgi:hypothetical protein